MATTVKKSGGMKKLLSIIVMLFAIAIGAHAQELTSSDIAASKAAIPQLKKEAAAGDHEAMGNLVSLYSLEITANYIGIPAAKNLGIRKLIPESKIIEYAQICVEEDDFYPKFLRNLQVYKTADKEAAALIAKYGLKAYNSIRKCKIYGGMPAALLTGYKTVEDDGSRYSFYYYEGSYVDRIGAYKKYVPNNLLAYTNSLGNVCPRIIKVRNGKVANIIW